MYWGNKNWFIHLQNGMLISWIAFFKSPIQCDNKTKHVGPYSRPHLLLCKACRKHQILRMSEDNTKHSAEDYSA